MVHVSTQAVTACSRLGGVAAPGSMHCCPSYERNLTCNTTQQDETEKTSTALSAHGLLACQKLSGAVAAKQSAASVDKVYAQQQPCELSRLLLSSAHLIGHNHRDPVGFCN